MAAFGGLLASAGLASKALGRNPQCQSALDLAVLSAATFKVARTLSRDDVTSFLRRRFGRLLTWSLGAAAANDFLQAGFAALAAKANELDSETS